MGGGGYSVCQGICIGSAGNTPFFNLHGTTKYPPFSAWSDVTPMWREAVLALARVPNPDRREESHVGARSDVRPHF